MRHSLPLKLKNVPNCNAEYIWRCQYERTRVISEVVDSAPAYAPAADFANIGHSDARPSALLFVLISSFLYRFATKIW